MLLFDLAAPALVHICINSAYNLPNSLADRISQELDREEARAEGIEAVPEFATQRWVVLRFYTCERSPIEMLLPKLEFGIALVLTAICIRQELHSK